MSTTVRPVDPSCAHASAAARPGRVHTAIAVALAAAIAATASCANTSKHVPTSSPHADGAYFHIDESGSLGRPSGGNDEDEVENSWQFGPMLAGGTGVLSEEGEITWSLGGGFIIDRSLIPDALELGLSLRATGGTEGLVLGSDVLVEIPYHVTELFELFAGLGGTVAFSTEHSDVAAGPLVVFGFHNWITHRFGFGLEVSYAYLFGSEEAHDVGALIGPMWEL